MKEENVHYSGLDFLAAILYYSNLEKVPADPGIEKLIHKAANNYQEKHGKVVCKRKTEDMLTFNHYENRESKIKNYFKFIFPRLFSTTIYLEDGFLHLTTDFKEMTEKNYIPYLSEEEKELAQSLGREFTSIAKDLPAGNLDITTVDIVMEADDSSNMKMIVSEEATNPKSYRTK